MNIKYTLLILAVLVLAGGTYALNVRNVSAPENGKHPIACTADAKLCPDGSAVGRVGPDCEFAECPEERPDETTNANRTSTLTGDVTLSPTCPVERVPPDPSCAPQPYETDIQIRREPGGPVIASTRSNAEGNFTIALAPGTYEVSAVGGARLPSCAPQTVILAPRATASVSLSCDTGIR